MDEEALCKLVHDVNSKCASLTSAAALLKGASEAERAEFLKLMRDQARSLFETLENARR